MPGDSTSVWKSLYFSTLTGEISSIIDSTFTAGVELNGGMGSRCVGKERLEMI